MRDARATVVHPETLGLGSSVDLRSMTVTSPGDALTDLLMRRAKHQAGALLESLYLAGENLAAILDGPLRTALERVGKIWRHGRSGIFLEHRAIQICVHALSQPSLLVPALDNAPVGFGGAVAGDPYLLPSMAAALVLTGEGFNAVNLGADVPVTTVPLNATPNLYVGSSMGELAAFAHGLLANAPPLGESVTLR